MLVKCSVDRPLSPQNYRQLKGANTARPRDTLSAINYKELKSRIGEDPEYKTLNNMALDILLDLKY